MASWQGGVWINDDWSEYDRAKALELVKQPQHHQDDGKQQQQQRQAVVFNAFRRNASTNWNSFYEQNQTNFFKDRHYLHKAFPEEFAWLYAHSGNNGKLDESGTPHNHNIPDILANDHFTIVEIGCGVGNAVLPLLEQYADLMNKHHSSSNDENYDDVVLPPQLHIHCLDFAPTAINLLKLDPRFSSAAEQGHATAHVYDLSSTHPSTISIPSTKNNKQDTLANSADVAILLFCLSAIGPHPSTALSRAARHVIDILKPGGTLVIRDYGRLDESQMKLSRGEKQLGNNFYRKGDGTGCYYFDLQDLKDLFVNNNSSNLELLELDYIQRIYRNRADNTTRKRVWIQGRFRKPFAVTNDCKSVVTSIGCFDDYSSTAAMRWDNHYLTTSKTLSLPSDLFQIFPNEFSPWQSLMNQHKKGQVPNIQPPQPSYETISISTNTVSTILDLGCGLGNKSLLNLVQTLQQQHTVEEMVPKVKAYFLDISGEAINQLRNDGRYQSCIASDSVVSQVYDLRRPQPTLYLDECADIVLLLYVMSAIGPYNCDDMKNAVTNAIRMLKQGGVLLFRDFGRYDDDQLQLNSVPGAQLHSNFYLRGDDDDDDDSDRWSELGIGCYFFDLNEVREMFVSLEVLHLEYSSRTYKKTGKSAKDLNKNGGAVERKRIWVDGSFRKPR